MCGRPREHGWATPGQQGDRPTLSFPSSSQGAHCGWGLPGPGKPQQTAHSLPVSCHVFVFTAAPSARLFQRAKGSVCEKNVAERQEAAAPGSPGSLTATQLAKTSQTPRRVTQRPRGQGHRLRDTLHPHPPDGPAPPWARALPRVLKASARLAA